MWKIPRIVSGYILTWQVLLCFAHLIRNYWNFIWTKNSFYSNSEKKLSAPTFYLFIEARTQLGWKICKQFKLVWNRHSKADNDILNWTLILSNKNECKIGKENIDLFLPDQIMHLLFYFVHMSESDLCEEYLCSRWVVNWDTDHCFWNQLFCKHHNCTHAAKFLFHQYLRTLVGSME